MGKFNKTKVNRFNPKLISALLFFFHFLSYNVIAVGYPTRIEIGLKEWPRLKKGKGLSFSVFGHSVATSWNKDATLCIESTKRLVSMRKLVLVFLFECYRRSSKARYNSPCRTNYSLCQSRGFARACISSAYMSPADPVEWSSTIYSLLRFPKWIFLLRGLSGEVTV